MAARPVVSAVAEEATRRVARARQDYQQAKEPVHPRSAQARRIVPDIGRWTRQHKSRLWIGRAPAVLGLGPVSGSTRRPSCLSMSRLPSTKRARIRCVLPSACTMAGVDTALCRSDELPAGLVDPLRRLLDDAFEGRFSDEDWRHCLGGWHVLVLDGQAPTSHAAVVRRVVQVGRAPFQCGYIEGVATTPIRQRQGLGGAVMLHAAAILHREFEMGALSTSNQRFYERFGWERWLGPTFVH